MYHIPAEFIQARGRILCFEIHKFTDHIWNKKELPQQRMELNILPICKEEYKRASSIF
jgi:hypothetical protein